MLKASARLDLFVTEVRIARNDTDRLRMIEGYPLCNASYVCLTVIQDDMKAQLVGTCICYFYDCLPTED